MLYNVIFGNEKLAPDPWETISENGFTFYEKKDIRQRIRIDPLIDEPVPLEQLWTSNSVQAYSFGEDVRYIPNGRNLNGVLRPIIKNRYGVDQSKQILVYVTVMNNYHIIDFRTPYTILGTYHNRGKWQGCIISMSEDDITTHTLAAHSKTDALNILSVYAYNKKKGTPNLCTISFTTKDMIDDATESTIKMVDIDHVVTKISTIKDAAEKERVITQYNSHEGNYMGFKCVLKPMMFLTSTYFVSADMKELAPKILPKKIKDIVVVPDSVRLTNEALADFVGSYLKDKRIRAITLIGIELPLSIIQENRLLYVFKYNEQYKTLECMKSN